MISNMNWCRNSVRIIYNLMIITITNYYILRNCNIFSDRYFLKAHNARIYIDVSASDSALSIFLHEKSTTGIYFKIACNRK